MKKMSHCFIALLLVSMPMALAQAANEGPHGVPVLPPVQQVIAEYQSVGGFVPTPYINGSRLDVYSDGRVLSTIRGSTSLILTLAPQTVSKLRHQIDQVQDLALVDQDAGQPLCTDRPVSTYRVWNSAGEIDLFQNRNCHRFVNQDAYASRIVEILNAFIDLSHS